MGAIKKTKEGFKKKDCEKIKIFRKKRKLKIINMVTNNIKIFLKKKTKG